MCRAACIARLAVFLSAAVLGQTSAATGEAADRGVVDRSGRIHPRLLEEARGVEGDDTRIEVAVSVRAGAKLDLLLDHAMRRPFVDPLGLQMVVGRVRLDDLNRLANLDVVVEVRPATSLIEPPAPGDPDLPDPRRERPDRGAVSSTKDWYEATDVHHFRQAWDNGFTGRGVRVMVNDSGIDFCHPDLAGTWATVDDAESPHFGWPLMFDAHSMYLLARDQYYGENNIRNGAGHYADTTATCSEGSPCRYRPVGSSRSYSYTLPGTSAGGTYRIGSHPDSTLESDGSRAAVLLADETTAGVFDTVYVDLNQDRDFTNDPAASFTDPAACGTYGGRAYSGGLVYFIADGVNPVPASDWFWELDAPGNGDLVAFIIDDSNEDGKGHGTKCASAVTAQGVVNGGAPAFKPASQGPGGGMVLGAARDAKLVAVGNTYNNPALEDPFLMAALGYDGEPGTLDDCQIVTDSWGHSTVDNDGWDLGSRLIDAIQQVYGPNLTVLFSAGNGGPGYGTIGPPAPPSGILVAAATEMGSTGWDGITDAEQIRWGDLIPFSSRGPEMRGTVGIQVAAVGAYGAGDITVNESSSDVENAWTTWGGTSRACPVAAGHLALIYDAYRQASGAWPTADVARAIAMGGAVDLFHDPFNQGAGLLNAERSTAIAGGTARGVYVTPPQWAVGDYRGVEFPAFANIVLPGQAASATFTVVNPGAETATLDVNADRLIKVDTTSFDWTTAAVRNEASYDFDRPNYLLELTDLIPEGTDLMVVRVIMPLEELDRHGDLIADSTWRFLLYDWTDDGDGQFWVDGDGNGTVNPGELDDDDAYVRYTYSRNVGTSQELRLQRPLERMHDGVWFGLQHQERDLEITPTHFQVSIEFYRRQAWAWVNVPGSIVVPAGGTTTFEATMTVPESAAAGLYAGAVRLDNGVDRTSVPISALVAAQLAAEPVVFGGASADTPYDNGVVSGLYHWTSRAYDGDWRVFFFDVTEGPGEGARLLVGTTWQDTPVTDIDTIVLGPVDDPDFSAADPARYGPYRLEDIGRSPYWRFDAGTWGYNTSTGGSRDWVSAPLREGLHAILLHNVLGEGSVDAFRVPLTVTAGWFQPSSDTIEVNASVHSGRLMYLVTTGSVVGALSARVFGFACEPWVTGGSVVEDGEFVLEIPVENSGRLDVRLDGPTGSDLDLTLYDPEGYPTPASDGSGPDERLVVDLPRNGVWRARVTAPDVPGTSATFEISVDSIAGENFGQATVPAGPFAAGEGVPIRVDYTLPEVGECDDWRGLLVYGPPGGEVIEVPISLVSQSSRQGTRRISP